MSDFQNQLVVEIHAVEISGSTSAATHCCGQPALLIEVPCSAFYGLMLAGPWVQVLKVDKHKYVKVPAGRPAAASPVDITVAFCCGKAVWSDSLRLAPS